MTTSALALLGLLSAFTAGLLIGWRLHALLVKRIVDRCVRDLRAKEPAHVR
jgi:hypothetical protein